jgi:hypothetical protein
MRFFCLNQHSIGGRKFSSYIFSRQFSRSSLGFQGYPLIKHCHIEVFSRTRRLMKKYWQCKLFQICLWPSWSTPRNANLRLIACVELEHYSISVISCFVELVEIRLYECNRSKALWFYILITIASCKLTSPYSYLWKYCSLTFRRVLRWNKWSVNDASVSHLGGFWKVKYSLTGLRNLDPSDEFNNFCSL